MVLYVTGINCEGWSVFLTCFVGGSHQRSAGYINEAHIIPNFLPVGEPLRSDVFLHLNPNTRCLSVHSFTKCAFFPHALVNGGGNTP